MEKTYTILVCDDEKDIVSGLKMFLEMEQYKVLCAYSGEEALALLETEDVHLVLMDVMMPGISGVEAIIKLRSFGNKVPVILLTAKSEDGDKVLGLKCGADDYITKPFNIMEVLARVHSQLRRYMDMFPNDNLSNGSIELNNKTKEVFVDGRSVRLTPTEFEILKLFMEHPNEVYSLSDIYQHVWKDEAFGAENTVAVHIRHLREKIEIDPATPKYIKVVWGQGYKMTKE